MAKNQVSMIIGSNSDLPIIQETAKILGEFKVPYELKILSAHRTPDELSRYVRGLSDAGIKVIIAAAGGAAALSGVVASHTDLPVVGVPVETKSLKGLDSLLSTVQMPPGIPVATVAIGAQGAKNAALLAVRILALHNPALKKALRAYKTKTKKTILALNRAKEWKKIF
ncbi:MAG: 5-(carboxyamino)imidazole ribonucleotide mutase [Candidatus Omnitrophota bacterium]